MISSLLIMLREGFEAALVVALVLTYLRRIDRLDLARSVWLGVGVALATAIAIGVGIRVTIGTLEGVARFRAFAVVSLVAVAVLTWMIFWMRRQSRLIKGDLERKVDAALHSPTTRRTVAIVAGVAVVREGIESALFLLALSDRGNPVPLLVGAVLGVAIAVALAALIYIGGRRIPMRAFFTTTAVILIVFAAGLTAHAVQLLQATGDLGSFNLNGVYDLRSQAWLTQSTQSGRFLSALVGWDPRPSIEQVGAWFLYLVPMVVLYLSPVELSFSRVRSSEASPADGSGSRSPAEMSAS